MTYQAFCTGGTCARPSQGAVRNDTVEMNGGRGFSLIEFMVGAVVVLTTMAVAFSVLGKYQKAYQGEQLAADLHQGIRSAMELLSQEVGQAGYLGFSARLLTNPVTGSTLGQTVPISSADSLFVNENVVVGSGVAQERVKLTAVDATENTVTGVFRNTHPDNAPVNTLGTFSQGVLPTFNPNKLQLFGDINGDGTLVYVEYNYTPQVGTVPGTLTRSITPISANAKNAPQVLVRNIVANPNAAPCFRYYSVISNSVVYVTQISVTLSTRSADLNPETKQYRTMTSSLVVAPRNVQAAYGLAQIPVTDRLQETPSNVTYLAQ